MWHLPVRAVCAKVSLSSCHCGQCQVPKSRTSSCSLLLPQRHQCKCKSNTLLAFTFYTKLNMLNVVIFPSPLFKCSHHCFSRHQSVGAVSLLLVSVHAPQTMSRCCRPLWSQTLSASSCMWWTQGQRWEIRNKHTRKKTGWSSCWDLVFLSIYPSIHLFIYYHLKVWGC